MLREYLWGSPDKAYLDWLYPQLRNGLINGQLFLFLTFSPIAWVGYLYYYADYLAALPVPEPKIFGIAEFFRLLAAPMINLFLYIYVKSKPNISTVRLTQLMVFSIGMVASTLIATAIAQTYYDAEFYMYEIIILIVFAQILLGLTFKDSVACSAIMACTALIYLLLDDVSITIKVYDSTIILTVWLPVLFGAMMLEQSRRLNFEAISKLEATTQELSIKNDDLQQFAYASSHDLQEPLRSITNFVGLLEKKLSPQLTPDQKVYFNIVLASTIRMQNLIHSILEYSRIGRNKSLETFSADEVLQEVLNNLNYAIDSSKAIIEATPLPLVQGYRIEFSMLLQNLIGNAIKFHKPGTSPHVKITASFENEHLLFAVADKGIGIDPQYTKKVFNLFGRLHSKEEYEGTGIGLTHCKKIVELHGGKIWLKSAPGKGSTFYFTIPQINNQPKYAKKNTLHHAY